MIISKTPFRISFFGGGTDIPAFYEKEFGCVISSTMDKYIYLVMHESFDKKHKISYSQIEHVSTIEEIEHKLVKEIMGKLDIKEGIEIHSIAEVPAGTGLGSSSAFAVGLLNLLYTYKGIFAHKSKLASEASEIEIENLKKPIGKQDQYASAFGGLNFIKFNQDGTVSVDPIRLSSDNVKKLNERLVLFYLDNTREASSVLEEQSNNIKSKEDKFETMRKLKQITLKMREELDSNNISNFGGMLHESWMLKRSIASKISNPQIDKIYSRGISAGAIGGKVLGAGGGGFILFYCEPDKQENLRKALSSLREFKFGFDTEGTRIIYSQ